MVGLFISSLMKRTITDEDALEIAHAIARTSIRVALTDELIERIATRVVEKQALRTDKLLTAPEAREYCKRASTSAFSRFCRRNFLRPIPDTDLYSRSALDLACDREARRRAV